MSNPLLRTTSNFNKYLSAQNENEPLFVSLEFQNQKWQSVQKYEKLFFDGDGLKLDTWIDLGVAVPVKSGAHRTVYRLRFEEGTFYLKHFKTADWKAQMQTLLSRSKSMREFRAAAMVNKSGLSTIQPVAVGWEREGRFVKHSYLITREIEGAEPLDVFVFKTLRGMNRTQLSETRRRLAFDLGRLTGNLHRLGFLHKDFHAGNILIRTETPDFGKLYLIDLHALSTHFPVTARQRRKNLGQLHNFFSHFITDSDRLRFFRAYWQSLTLKEPHCVNRASQVDEIEKIEEDCRAVLKTSFRRSDKKWFRPNRRLFIENEAEASYRGLTWLGDCFRKRIENDPQEVISPIPGIDWNATGDGVETAKWELDLEDDRIEVLVRRMKSSTAAPASKRENQWSSLRMCWEYGHRLLRRGFECPRPLFLYETKNPNAWNYLLIETSRDVVSLNRWWSERRQHGRRSLEKLTKYLEKFHRFGFVFSNDSKELPLGYSQSGNRFTITDSFRVRHNRNSRPSMFSLDVLREYLDDPSRNRLENREPSIVDCD